MNDSIFTRRFWTRTAERVVRAAAIGAALAVGGGQFNAIEADWANVAGFAGGAAFLSLLLCLGAGVVPVGEPGTPSLVRDNPPPTLEQGPRRNM